MNIRIEQLTEVNFTDYETLTSCESGGGCYCAFWHQKITSMQEWDSRKKENPLLNRQIVLDKVRTGYHVGVLAYCDDILAAWISIGPLIDFYWTWKRIAQLGEAAKEIAAIMCFTIAPDFRGKGLQAQLLKSLIAYAAQRSWKTIEAYPFDESAVEKHGDAVIWPGIAKAYSDAGFTRISPHWLSGPEAERSIFRIELDTKL